VAGSKVYGCARPGEDEQQQHEHVQEAEGFLFAPLPGRLKGRMKSMVLDIVVCRNKQFLDHRVPLKHFMACLDK